MRKIDDDRPSMSHRETEPDKERSQALFWVRGIREPSAIFSALVNLANAISSND